MVDYSISHCWISQSLKRRKKNQRISNEKIGIIFHWFSMFICYQSMLDKNIQWTEKLKLTCICNMHPCDLDFQFNCNLTPQVFLLSASLCCSLSCFPNDPHTSIYSCPSCIALVHSSLLHHIVACTLAGTWELQETRCSSVSLLCVPSFLFYVHKVLLGVLVLQLKNCILCHLKEIVLKQIKTHA